MTRDNPLFFLFIHLPIISPMVIAIVFVIFKAITCREALFVVGLLPSICRVSSAIDSLVLVI